ncbi:hypothetical protein [Marinomonas sp. GJ51-6]|uniref:hypothetical protein n=1 Tax=Marinomonas sp. GJ51-6 TaxID=2992802 RepID=UPI0029341B31|nr:hypothetical protein [Marinomonas sp. GJ51-6]WOD06145.1 hypothetical protein ONZ50_10375 [Marinomonas sp. GJ51-6]
MLSQIPVDTQLANTDSIYLLRKSVALRQKELLNESLDKLEKSVLTAPASSDGEASIRAGESQMILEFTERGSDCGAIRQGGYFRRWQHCECDA